MIKSLALGDLTQTEAEELNKATEAMRCTRLQRAALKGDVDGYLQFLDDRQELFGSCAKAAGKKPLIIDRSFIL